MEPQADKATRFLQLHHGIGPLLLPNPWDVGSARLLEWLGFDALATTSSGFAATRGRLDGAMDRSEVLEHASSIAAATVVPVSADLENGFGPTPEQVAETTRLAIEAGLAGCSIEDFTGTQHEPIFDLGLATERIAAAADVAHAGPVHLVLTARAENYLHGFPDMADTIARLQAFQDAGADVLYAPGLTSITDIRRVVDSVAAPVNVLARPGGPTVPELADAGVARISVGGALCYAAFGAVIEAAEELKGPGTLNFLQRSAAGADAVRNAFARQVE